MRFDRGVELLLSGRRWLIVYPFRLRPEDTERIVPVLQIRPLVAAWFEDVNTYVDMIELYEELTGIFCRPPTTTQIRREIISRMIHAFEHGELVALHQPLFPDPPKREGPRRSRRPRRNRTRRLLLHLPRSRCCARLPFAWSTSSAKPSRAWTLRSRTLAPTG